MKSARRQPSVSQTGSSGKVVEDLAERFDIALDLALVVFMTLFGAHATPLMIFICFSASLWVRVMVSSFVSFGIALEVEGNHVHVGVRWLLRWRA
jgi:hypothetical protein